MALYLDLSKIVLNFIVFVALQTLFFYFVVSKFSLTIFKSKLKLISDFLKSTLDPNELLVLKNSLAFDIQQSSSKVQTSIENREKENISFLYKAISPILISSIVIFALLISFSSKKPDSQYYKILLVIIFSYFTEIAFFFIVMNRYEFIGTFGNIIRNIVPS